MKYFEFVLMNNKMFNRILGKEIKRVREQKRITQEELASRMNVNPQNISSYERGERCPSLFWMNRLYEALEIRPADFTEEFYQKLNTDSISPNITIINPASVETIDTIYNETNDVLSDEIINPISKETEPTIPMPNELINPLSEELEN